MFTLAQCLALTGVIVLPCIAGWLVTRVTRAMVDRDIRRYRTIEKEFGPGE